MLAGQKQCSCRENSPAFACFAGASAQSGVGDYRDSPESPNLKTGFRRTRRCASKEDSVACSLAFCSLTSSRACRHLAVPYRGSCQGRANFFAIGVGFPEPARRTREAHLQAQTQGIHEASTLFFSAEGGISAAMSISIDSTCRWGTKGHQRKNSLKRTLPRFALRSVSSEVQTACELQDCYRITKNRPTNEKGRSLDFSERPWTFRWCRLSESN